MTRAMTGVLLCMGLVTGIALAVECPPPEDKCAPLSALDCVSPNFCWVDVEWFAKYEGCKGDHTPVVVDQNFSLVLYTSNANPNRHFRVDQFKLGKLLPHDQCDVVGAKEVPDFTEPPSAAGQYRATHNLTATGSGCYAVSLQFKDGCRVDPHIIVRQFSPNAIPLYELPIESPQRKK